jgi:hypothetical protein
VSLEHPGEEIQDTNATVVLLHHERKRVQDVSYDPSQAAIGARAWANQADAHGTLTRQDRIAEVEDDGLPEDHRRLRSTFQWRPDTKGRGGEPAHVELVVVESEKDGRDRLLWLRATSEGRMEQAPGRSTLAKQIARVVHERGRMRRKQIAEAVGRSNPENPDNQFTQALKEAVGTRYLIEGEPTGQGWTSQGQRPRRRRSNHAMPPSI